MEPETAAALELERPAETIVSLGELASIPGVPSEPTLRKLLEANEDFPVVTRGTNGSAYEIPLERAISWLQARRREEEEAARRRSVEIRQLGLELLGAGAASEAVGSAAGGLSPAEQKAFLEAEVLAIRVGRERGELVRKAEVEAALGETAVEARRLVLALPDKVQKRADLTREAQAELRRQCAALLEDLAALWEGLAGVNATVPDRPAD